MKYPLYRLFFSTGAYFGPGDLRRITLAAVFAADEVLVPTKLQIDPNLGDQEQLALQRRLHELHEMGAIRPWEVEHGGDILIGVPAEQLVVFEPSLVVPVETYAGLIGSVEERLVGLKPELFPQIANFEGISEVALGKQTLWKLDLAKELDADRLLISHNTRGSMSQFLSELARPEASRYENFEEKILERLVAGLNLPDVSSLTAEELDRCRRLMPRFRAELLERHSGTYRELGLRQLIEAIAAGVMDEFNDVIESRGRESRLVGAGREVAWDLLQYLLPQFVVAKYASLFSRICKDSHAPLLLLLNLKDIQARRLSSRRE